MIPGDYTGTEFPLEYYFEVRMSDGSAGLYPGFLAEADELSVLCGAGKLVF